MVKQGLFRPRQPLAAVRGVNFSVDDGEVCGLVGESGCGKTTIARIIVGLEEPTSGEVLITGRPIRSMSRRALSRVVQPIFQDPYSSLNPCKSIRSIVTLPLRVHRIGLPEEWPKRAERMMDLVGLPSYVLDSFPLQLSGGQRQRVAIARALIANPRMVICDEPTSSLDVSVQSQILNLLQDLRRELGLTYLFISHNLAVVEHMATDISVMYLGRIVERGSAERLFRDPKHPYTRALLASVLTPEPGRGLPEAEVDTIYPNPLMRPSGCAFHPRCPQAMGICIRGEPPQNSLSDRVIECHLYNPDPENVSQPRARSSEKTITAS